MKWKSILKSKRSKGIALRSIKYIDELMSDGVSRTADEVKSFLLDSKTLVPSNAEITQYLKGSPKYELVGTAVSSSPFNNQRVNVYRKLQEE